MKRHTMFFCLSNCCSCNLSFSSGFSIDSSRCWSSSSSFTLVSLVWVCMSMMLTCCSFSCHFLPLDSWNASICWKCNVLPFWRLFSAQTTVTFSCWSINENHKAAIKIEFIAITLHVTTWIKNKNVYNIKSRSSSGYLKYCLQTISLSLSSHVSIVAIRSHFQRGPSFHDGSSTWFNLQSSEVVAPTYHKLEFCHYHLDSGPYTSVTHQCPYLIL
jgi:hypothetical protein